jgi:hypothetical protein
MYTQRNQYKNDLFETRYVTIFKKITKHKNLFIETLMYI